MRTKPRPQSEADRLTKASLMFLSLVAILSVVLNQKKMESLSKLELQIIINDYKQKLYLSKKDRECFLLANKLISKK